MKHKRIETPDEMLEHLQSYVCELMNENLEGLMINIRELDKFGEGEYSGAHDILSELQSYIRGLQKHGYQHLMVEDWEVEITKVKE